MTAQQTGYPELYKFTYSRYLDGFLAGTSVKVGTIDEYRGTDAPTALYNEVLSKSKPFSDEWYAAHEQIRAKGGIDDPFEGRAVLHVGAADSGVEADRKEAERIRKEFGVDIFGGARGSRVYSFQNIYTSNSPNCYIFSCSGNREPQTVERVRADSAAYSKNAEPYDVGIPIVNPGPFFNALTLAIAKYENFIGDNPNVVASVGYINRKFSFGEEPTPPSPSVKDPFFSSQNEVRYIHLRPIPVGKFGRTFNLEVDCRGFFGEPFKI